MKRVLLLVAAVFAALLVVPSSAAWACSCAPPPSTPEAVSGATTVFAGTVLSMRGRGKWGADEAARYELVVRAVHKGSATAKTWVGEDPDSCGLGMLEGREYVVFARGGPDRLVSSNCAGTDQAASGLVADVEQVAGPGRSPASGTSGQRVSDNAWLVPLVGGGALALLLGAGLVLVLLRGRRRS